MRPGESAEREDLGSSNSALRCLRYKGKAKLCGCSAKESQVLSVTCRENPTASILITYTKCLQVAHCHLLSNPTKTRHYLLPSSLCTQCAVSTSDPCFHLLYVLISKHLPKNLPVACYLSLCLPGNQAACKLQFCSSSYWSPQHNMEPEQCSVS